MEKRSQSSKLQRQRKFLMILPLLVLPFITLMFWALGGGQTEEAAAQSQLHEGFNLQLPDAYFKEDKQLNKMSYYDEAQSDSAKLKQQMKNDPYYQIGTGMPELKNPQAFESGGKSSSGNVSKLASLTGGTQQDMNETQVYLKLEQLNAALEKAERFPQMESQEDERFSASPITATYSADLDSLGQMMQTLDEPGKEDPEMRQIDEMLEKVLDIQHPDRVRSRIKQSSKEKKGEVLAVSTGLIDDHISLMTDGPDMGKADSNPFSEVIDAPKDFHSIDDPIREHEASNAIEAVVHETQTLLDGSTVKLRILNDVSLNGILIPKNNFLYGTASLHGERLQVSVNSIRFRDQIFRVDLSVYDLDGIIGIYIPEALTHDVVKRTTDRAMQGIVLGTYDASVGAQAAGAGIEAAKSLFSKKVRHPKVTVKAGYHVLLLDEKQQKTS
jgi:conjugative transposon TraM protein